MSDPEYLSAAEAAAYERRRAAMMGEFPPPETFDAWLARRKPGVRLTEMQLAWAHAQEQGVQFMWAGGRSSGRTFVTGLYEQFLRERG